MIDNMPDGVVLFDQDLRVRFIDHRRCGVITQAGEGLRKIKGGSDYSKRATIRRASSLRQVSIYSGRNS